METMCCWVYCIRATSGIHSSISYKQPLYAKVWRCGVQVRGCTKQLFLGIPGIIYIVYRDYVGMMLLISYQDQKVDGLRSRVGL